MAISIAARLRDWKMRFESHKEKVIFLFYTKFRPALGSTQPLSKGNRVISWGLSGRDEKSTVRLYLLPRLRNVGEIILFLLYALLALIIYL